MKKLNRGWLAIAGSLVGVIAAILLSTPVVSQPSVGIITDPPLNQTIPLEQPVQLTLQAVDTAGKPLSDVDFQLQLLTPDKTPWLSSDFPIVEGTTLLSMETDAPQGKLQFQQVFPIRGNYQLQVEVTPKVAGAFEPFRQSLSLSVPENPVKYRNLAILAVILLLVGCGSGWVIGTQQNLDSAEIAPQPVRWLLSGAIVVAIIALLVVNISAELASTHSHHHDHGSSSQSGEVATSALQRSQNLEVKLSGDTHATVGQLATQTVQITNVATGQPVKDVPLNIQAIGLEENEVIFAYQTHTNEQGSFTWQEQFYDGAPHQVVVAVPQTTNSAQPTRLLQVAHEIEVDAIAPPLTTRLITLVYFIALFVLGLLVGLGLRRRWTPGSVSR